MTRQLAETLAETAERNVHRRGEMSVSPFGVAAYVDHDRYVIAAHGSEITRSNLRDL